MNDISQRLYMESERKRYLNHFAFGQSVSKKLVTNFTIADVGKVKMKGNIEKQQEEEKFVDIHLKKRIEWT